MKIIYGSVIVDGEKSRRPILLEKRFCEECGLEFQPVTQASKYCSRKCSKKAEHKRNAERYKQKAKEWYEDNLEKARERRKEYYWKNPNHWREKTREWGEAHPKEKRQRDCVYKDKTRHGEKRQEMIKKFGLKCSECGLESENEFDIVLHHVKFDPQDHSEQVLLCRSCHAKVHNFGQIRNH